MEYDSALINELRTVVIHSRSVYSQTRLADFGYIPECKSKNPRGLNQISLLLARMESNYTSHHGDISRRETVWILLIHQHIEFNKTCFESPTCQIPATIIYNQFERIMQVSSTLAKILVKIRLRGYENNFMLKSAEHEIFPARKC